MENDNNTTNSLTLQTLSTPEQMQQLVSLLTELSEKLQNSLGDRNEQELKPRLQSEGNVTSGFKGNM